MFKFGNKIYHEEVNDVDLDVVTKHISDIALIFSLFTFDNSH